jgi:hypothetical protein
MVVVDGAGDHQEAAEVTRIAAATAARSAQLVTVMADESRSCWVPR